jgi:hypothetical protein
MFWSTGPRPVVLVDVDTQKAALREIYRRLIALKATDSGIPGSGEPVLTRTDSRRGPGDGAEKSDAQPKGGRQ